MLKEYVEEILENLSESDAIRLAYLVLEDVHKKNEERLDVRVLLETALDKVREAHIWHTNKSAIQNIEYDIKMTVECEQKLQLLEIE